MAIPQTKTNAVADMIFDLEVNGATEFGIAAIRRRISEVKQASVAESEMLEGMLYAVLGNYDKAIECHRAATSKRPGDYVLMVNHGISLKKLSDFSGAYEVFKKCCEINPASSTVIEHIISTAIISGKLSEASRLAERYFQLADNEDIRNKFAVFQNFMDGLKKIKISESQLHRFTIKAEQLMREYGVVTRRYSSDIMSFEGDAYLVLNIDVALDGKHLASINSEFAALTAADDELEDCWDKLIINFANGYGMDAPQAAACK